MARYSQLFSVKYFLLVFVFALAGALLSGGSTALAYGGADRDRCLDTTHEVGVVVFVAIYDHNNNFRGYSNSFDFRTDNNIDSASDGNLKRRAHNSVIKWENGVKQAFGQFATRTMSVRPGTPFNLGNMCDPTPTGGGSKVHAYAFRSGDGTERRIPNGGESNQSVYNNSGRYPARDWECVQKDRNRYRSSSTASWGAWGGWGTDCDASAWTYQSWVYSPTPSINDNGWSCSTANISATHQRQTCTYGDDLHAVNVGYTAGGPFANWDNNGSFSLSCLGVPSVKFEFFPLANYDTSYGSWGGSFVGSTNVRRGNPNNLTFDGSPLQVIKSADNQQDLNGTDNTVIFKYRLNAPPPPANITPSVSLSPTPIIEAGETYTATASFQNTSSTAGNVTATWRTWMDSDQTYGNGGESNVTTTAINQTVAGNSTYTVSPNATGTADSNKLWVCTELFSLTVTNPSTTETPIVQPGTRKVCIAIAKAPGFSVERADVRAGGRFIGAGATACTLALPAYPADTNFAPIRGHNYPNAKSSLVEHGLLTPGRITEIKKTFVSDSALRFGTSTWAFPDGRYLGNVAQASAETHCLPDVAGLYGKLATPHTDVLPLNTVSSGEYEMDSAGSETLTVCFGGCVLGPNGEVVIRATKPAGAGGVKTVRIAGNITYAGGPYATVNAIPRFVLIADPGVEVEVAADVTEVNGIISAGSKLRTCDSREGGPSGSMTIDDCNVPLFMRAVVITEGRIYPFRTAGFSSATDNSFAEVFRVAPGLVLADYARAKAAPVMTTQHMSELPPRF